MLRSLSSILRYLNNHPLAGKHRVQAYQKFITWQLANLFNHSEKKVSFTDKTFLIVKKSMKGATGNIYLGLHEFEDMGFLLHFLRKEDVFFDIGANIGSYMVLASGHVGCRSLAFEPIPSTFHFLKKNIIANKISEKVNAFNVGVGSEKGNLIFTSDNDTVNHVIEQSATTKNECSLEVPVISIDEEIVETDIPALIKIDVEGFETEVLLGMKHTLQQDKLKGIIIELNGSGGRYGFDENNIHSLLTDAGFLPFSYDPFERKLVLLETYGRFNTLYLRDLDFIRERLKSAENINLFSESF